ncbi:NAD(P)/FAD-dependent oxidoreductase [Saccharopolyspora pogona]|uniref:NAD(P)/FAD-dependent oxidoreductase n=1 Tax=Saccharopolyspora pogona TaxID=333966 RepID=UPI001685BA6A|nr:FAD-dependent oxidoreductase [Saccharopolyspora pogona]
MREIGTLDTADIVVVGGGVVGLTTALELRKRGFDVVVVEQRFLAFGASGRNSGAVWLQTRRAGIELELARRGLHKYAEYEDSLGPTFEFRQRGGLFFYETEAQRAVFEGYVADRIVAGLDVSIVSRDEAMGLSPVVPDTALGAVYCADDAQVDASAFVRAVGGACLRMGVRLFENTAVLGTIRKVDTVSGVSTVRGEIHAGAVVWATGAWSVNLRAEGIDLPIDTYRVGQLVTQPVTYTPGSILHGPRGVGRCGALADLPEFDPEVFSPPAGAGGAELAYDDTVAQNTEGAVLIGNSIDGRGTLNPHISMRATHAMIDAALGRSERYGGLGVTGLWAGLVAETADQLPIIDAIDGLYVNTAHSFGVASGPVGGEVLARLLIGESDPLADKLGVARPSLAP